MKVCIISPSIFYFDYQVYPFALYHLPYLYSYMRQHLPGVEVSVVDLELEMGHANRPEEVDEFMRIAELRLGRLDFDVVGISCWTSMHYLSTMAIARLCKRLNPDCTIVVGGYHPSYVPQDFEFPGTPIDFIVMGEGEEAFNRIVAGRIPQETKPQRVPGIQIDLADLNLLWDEYPYYRNTYVMGLFMSRGCPFACSFCLDRRTRYRGYTARQAIAELKKVFALLPNVHQIQLCDSLFGASKEWRREFLPLLAEMKPEAQFWAETRVHLFQPEDLDQLARLRFMLNFGLEHVSPRMLRIMNKSQTPDKHLEAFETVDAYMNKIGIPHAVYLMFNYPGETPETQQQLYDYWMRYYDENPDNWTYASPALHNFYPGCEEFYNWKHYEETYGARVLSPEWWKTADPRQRGLRGAIIPSRELLEANLVHRGLQYTEAIMLRSVQTKHPVQKARQVAGSATHATRYIPSIQASYLDDKPLKLQALSYLHRKVNSNLMLYNFETGIYFNAGKTTSDTLRSILEKGITLDGLVERHASIYPNPEGHRRKLRRLFWDLASARFITLDLAPSDPLPVPPARPRVALNTTAGRIVLELYGTEVPRTVANFLYLIRRRFYDGLYFCRTVPETFVQVGTWNYHQGEEGPGYTLVYESSPFSPERGSLSMVREGPHLNGAQFYIWRAAEAPYHRQETVFGHVVEGMACVDRILMNQDWIREAVIEEEEARNPALN